MMVGGEKATYDWIHPLLLDIGPKATCVGPNGAAVSMKIALEMGKQLGVTPPTGAIANQFLTAARGLGLEKEDCAVLFHVLAKIPGVPA